MTTLSRTRALAALGGVTASAILPRRARATAAAIRIATPPNDSGAEVYYAVERGIFHDAGLNVELVPVTSTGALVAAVIGGSIDIANMSLPSFLTARDKGAPVAAVAPASLYRSSEPTSALVVSGSSSIRRATDLDGKAVAVRELTNIAAIAARAWISKNGGVADRCRFIELSDADAIGALSAGRIDAASLSEPFLAHALATGARVLATTYDAIGPEFLIAIYFATRTYTRSQPTLVEAFAAAIERTATWANAHRDLSAPILEKYSHSTIAPSVKRVWYAERFDPRAIKPVVDALVSEQVIKPVEPAATIALT